jgi:hypothetical protein
MKKQFKILILSLLIPFLGFSNNDDWAFTKQKNIKKAYLVNADAGINIDNYYGNIYVTTWDEDKIELDILIKVSGNSEKWVNNRIDDIDVDIEALKSMVTAKTIIAKSDNYNSGSNNSIEINYTLKIPKNGNVNLSNKYGDIIVGDIINKSEIICKYGKITLGKLNGSSNRIQIEYCTNSEIEFIKNGNVEARYSGLKINKGVNLELDLNYTDFTILESQNVKYDCNYGKLKLVKVNSITGSGNHLAIDIGEIFNNLNLEANYCKIIIREINDNANNVAISSGYSDISIGYNPNYVFDFDIYLKFGNLKSEENIEMIIVEENRNSKHYSGFYKKKGVNKVSINSNYGNVTIKRTIIKN